MPDQIFFPIDIVMWIINIIRKKWCGGSDDCNIVFLGLRMLSHFISAIVEFIILNINNVEYARYDSPSTGLFGWIVFLLFIMPFVYIGCLANATLNFRCGSWFFKTCSISFDIFFLSYTVYITKALQGDLRNLATLIVVGIGLEFTVCFSVVVLFNCWNVDNEVDPL